MTPTLIGIIGIVAMLALFMTRMPVAYVMALVGYAGFSVVISGKGGLNLLSRNIYEAFSCIDTFRLHRPDQLLCCGVIEIGFQHQHLVFAVIARAGTRPAR